MATATSRKAAPDKKVLARRRKVATDLLALHHKLKPDFAKMEALEAELKGIATAAGESFKEQFGADYVSASGSHAAEFKGDVPVVQSEAWLGLKSSERKRLELSGLIAVEAQWGKASNGRVTVKVH